MKFNREGYEQMGIDMTPLVDCIFAIILFLVAASSFEQALEQDLKVDLPTQGREVKMRATPGRPVVVNVRNMPGNKPFYHIENEQMTVPGLRAYLSRAKINRRDQVIIRGDRNVKWEHIAKVMSCCAEAGITKVSATVAIREGTD